MILNELIVKVITVSGSHNYRVGEFYKIGTSPLGGSASYKLLELVKIPGIPFTGNSIRASDFVHIDPFSDNEEFTAFIKQKEELIVNQLTAILKTTILLKEEIRCITTFSNKEDYMIECITKCKDGLSDDEDEGSKQIVSLLASLT